MHERDVTLAVVMHVFKCLSEQRGHGRCIHLVPRKRSGPSEQRHDAAEMVRDDKQLQMHPYSNTVSTWECWCSTKGFTCSCTASGQVRLQPSHLSARCTAVVALMTPAPRTPIRNARPLPLTARISDAFTAAPKTPCRGALATVNSKTSFEAWRVPGGERASTCTSRGSESTKAGSFWRQGQPGALSEGGSSI